MIYIYMAMYIPRSERDSISRRVYTQDSFTYICIATRMWLTHHNGPYSTIQSHHTCNAHDEVRTVRRYIFYLSIQDCKVRQCSLHPGQNRKEYDVFCTDHVFCLNCLECTLTHTLVFSTIIPTMYSSFTSRCSPHNSRVFM